MSVRESVARSWHAGSDHAKDGTPFGGPLCNCWQVAERMLPMLAEAWEMGREYDPNPYKTEEDRHVDQ